jgi:hypothetical protein
LSAPEQTRPISKALRSRFQKRCAFYIVLWLNKRTPDARTQPKRTGVDSRGLKTADRVQLLKQNAPAGKK